MDLPSTEQLLEDLLCSKSRDEATLQYVTILCEFPTVTDDHVNSKESSYITSLLKSLKHFIEHNDPESFITVSVACCTIIKTHPSHHQRSFQESGVFQTILDLLPHVTHTESFSSLFHLLIVLLDSNYNKVFCASTSFYNSLFTILTSQHSKDFLSSSFFCDLMLTFVTGNTWKQGPTESTPIKNSDGAVMILKLLPNLSFSAQSYLLSSLVSFCEASSHNRTLLCVSGAVDVLLSISSGIDADHPSINHFFELLQQLASHSLSVAQLKYVFRLLKSKTVPLDKSKSISARPPFYTRVLRLLLTSLEMENKAPTTFFSLDGISSGIQMSVLDSWPKNGWSFSIWFKISSFLNYDDVVPTLFSFESEEGEVMSCTISSDNRQLSFHVTKISNPKRKILKNYTATITETELITGRWYHLLLSQAPKGLYSNTNDLCVYLDGSPSIVSKAYYPSFSSALTKCFVGSHLCGCLGPLSSRLTPNSLLDSLSSLSSYIFAAYSARAVSGDRAIDFAPLGLRKLYRNNATLLSGTIVTKTSNIRSAIFALGGIPVLFPLLTQMDQPLLGAADCIDTTTRSLSSFFEDSVLPSVLELFCKVIEKSHANQSTLISIDGIKVIGLLLQRITPNHMSIAAVNLLHSLVTESLTLELKYAVVRFILLEARIWTFTPLPSHLNNLDFVLKIAAKEPSLFKRKIGGIEYILDLLRDHYWYFRTAEHRDKPITCYHPITGMEVAHRPSTSDIYRIRTKLMDLIMILLSTSSSTKFFALDNFEAEDAVSLARYAVTVGCEKQTFEMLTLLKSLLSSERHLIAVEALCSLGGPITFLDLLKSTSDDVRLAALDIIVILHDITSTNTDGFDFSSSDTFWLSVIHSLCSTPLSLAVSLHYFALLSGQDCSMSHVYSATSFNSLSLPDFGEVVVRPYLYPVILHHCGMYSDDHTFDLQCQVLHQLLLSVTHNHQNGSIFINQSNWSRGLFNLLYAPWLLIGGEEMAMTELDFDCDHDRQSNMIDCEFFHTDNPKGFVLLDLAVNFCQQLFFILFTREPSFSCSILSYFLFELKSYCKSNNIFQFYFYSVFSIFDQLCQSLTTRSHLIRNSTDPVLKENISSFFTHLYTEIDLYQKLILNVNSFSFPLFLNCDGLVEKLKQRVITTLTLLNWSMIYDYSDLNLSSEKRFLLPNGGLIHMYTEYLIDFFSSCDHKLEIPKQKFKENKAYFIATLHQVAANKKLLKFSFLSVVCGSLIENFRYSFNNNSPCDFLRIMGEYLIKENKDKLGDRNPWVPIFKSNSLLFADPSILSETSLSANCSPEAFLNILSSGKWPHFEVIVQSALENQKLYVKHEDTFKELYRSSLSGVDFIVKYDDFALQCPTVKKCFANSAVFEIGPKDLKIVESHVTLCRRNLQRYTALILSAHEREVKRRLAFSERVKRDDESAVFAWRRISRMVRHERSPWGYRDRLNHSELNDCEVDDFVSVFNQIQSSNDGLWQLDFTENSSRMRLLLEPNFSGSKHEGKVARQKGNKERDNSTTDKPEFLDSFNLNDFLNSHGILDDDDVDDTEELTQLVTQSETAQNSSKVNSNLGLTERTYLVINCERVSADKLVLGTLKITSKFISFTDSKELSTSDFEEKTNFLNIDSSAEVTGAKIVMWDLADIISIQSRRYLLSPTALEIFFRDNSSVFLNFGNKRTKESVQYFGISTTTEFSPP
ncbi:hypothetical protein GEMRC1_006194 [Eukaryota sp. GEM-RC1]